MGARRQTSCLPFTTAQPCKLITRKKADGLGRSGSRQTHIRVLPAPYLSFPSKENKHAIPSTSIRNDGQPYDQSRVAANARNRWRTSAKGGWQSKISTSSHKNGIPGYVSTRPYKLKLSPFRSVGAMWLGILNSGLVSIRLVRPRDCVKSFCTSVVMFLTVSIMKARRKSGGGLD